MIDDGEEKKLCPIFVGLVAHDNFVQINPDAALHMARCHEDCCAWWNNLYECCAIKAISVKLLK